MNYADVTLEISTKDRYDILHLCLMSIANQTLLPREIIIYDDGECRDLREDYIYKGIFNILNLKRVEWKVLRGKQKGQIYNHQQAIKDAKYDWIYRVDDDNILEPNVLERLYSYTKDPTLGAVGGVVVHPEYLMPAQATSNRIEDCSAKYGAQFAGFPGVKEVDHLYSTFLYRKAAAKHGYPLYLSRIAHHEETIFSYEMKLAGWKLLVDGDTVTYHLRAPRGGIRSPGNERELWESDNATLQKKLKKWGIKPTEYFFMLNLHALGDNFIMKSILPEVRRKYPNKKIMIGTLFGGIYFDEPDVEAVVPEVVLVLSQIPAEHFDAYKYGFDHNWTGHMKDIYRRIYNL